jgi:predicted NAD/FAD-dependent oxidoreductase
VRRIAIIGAGSAGLLAAEGSASRGLSYGSGWGVRRGTPALNTLGKEAR